MKQDITYNQEKEVFIVSMEIPKYQTGKYTYMFEEETDDSPTWTQPAVSVFLNRKWCEYTLNHTIYLDYKDSLQTGQAILFFRNEEEATEFAKKHKLMVEIIDNDYDRLQDQDTVTPTNP